jgi:hypothetical protein
MCGVDVPERRFFGLKERKRIKVLGLEMFVRQLHIRFVRLTEL